MKWAMTALALVPLVVAEEAKPASAGDLPEAILQEISIACAVNTNAACYEITREVFSDAYSFQGTKFVCVNSAEGSIIRYRECLSAALNLGNAMLYWTIEPPSFIDGEAYNRVHTNCSNRYPSDHQAIFDCVFNDGGD